jgi:hypothetical protein
MSLIDLAGSLLPAGRVAQAAQSWREAVRVATARWDVFRGVEPETRTFAFAYCTAALDAEEKAAAAVARLVTSQAAWKRAQ